MTARELVFRALAGLPVPRCPVGPLAVHFCAGLACHSLRQYSTQARALAESVLAYYEKFRPDAIWISADTWVSAQAMGARVDATGPDQPLGGSGEPLVRTAADIDRIGPPDPSTQGRYPLMVEALARVVQATGGEVFVVACFDQYPFSLAAALMGMNEIMLRVHDDPLFVRALMDRCSEYALAYARALAETGADLLSGGDSPAGLLGPTLYRKLAQPAERELVQHLKAATGKPVSLHICGRATRLLAQMASTGADVLEIDSAVDLAEACRLVGPSVALWGNLDPVRLLVEGSPADVGRASRDAINKVRAAGHHRFVLSSGCTLAVSTPEANVHALIQTPREDAGDPVISTG